MENYLVVLLMSVFVLLGAFYIHTVEQRFQIKHELLQYGNKMKTVTEDLETTTKGLTQVKVELESTRNSFNEVKVELESTRKSFKEVKVELESTRKSFNEVKVELQSTRKSFNEVKVELESTREKDNARNEEIYKIRADFNASRDEFNVIKKENSGQTYIRWGKTSCPEESYLVYDGYAAGKHYNIGGSGSNLLCLSKNPEWKDYTEGDSPATGKIYGIEYEISQNKPYSKTFNDKNVPCAVCQSKRTTVLMVPGKVTCHSGWHKEFSGYLMSQLNTNSRTPSEYICVDEKLESVPGGDANQNEAVLYPVEAVCGSLKCPPYNNGVELTCVVCSK